MDHKPTKVTLNRPSRALIIEWSDGLTSEFPLSHLREACPCVECRGGHAKMGLEHAPEDLLKLTPRRSYEVTALVAVGNYALQPTWDDGHSTGIYTWEYLRVISPQQPDD